VVLFFLGVAAALPIYFTLNTKLAWEDFFITYRYAENLARGQGLVYSPGEHVQGFTSPLNTLIPAFFAFVLQAKDFVAPLWCYRAVSLFALLFGCVAATSILIRDQAAGSVRFWVGAIFPVVAALEIKTVAFAMSGQEAGLMIGFLGPLLAIAYLGWPRHYLLGGILSAGLMYTRPDGFIYVGTVAIAALAFEPGSRRTLFLPLVKSALICGVLYLPWFLFTWAYYGSPVPHTIVAKFGTATYSSPVYGLLACFTAGLVRAPSILIWALGPIYDQMVVTTRGNWPKWLHDSIALLELVAMFYWLVPTRDRLGRMASLATFFIFCYLDYTTLVAEFAPWYFPPLAFLTLFTLVCIVATTAAAARNRFVGHGSAGLMLAGVTFLVGFTFFMSLQPLRIKQEVIDWGNRRLIGLWLKDHVRPGEQVYLEPLGYIGYFSQCKMLDWPGLVSPAVVAVRRKDGRLGLYDLVEVADELKPDWLVLRPGEALAVEHRPSMGPHYQLQKVFDVRPQIDKFGDIPGIAMTFGEMGFAIYRRTDLRP